MTSRILAVFLVLLSLQMFMVADMGQCSSITMKKAIEIADTESVKLGYDIALMSVKASKHKSPWNEYLSKDSTDEYSQERVSKLKGHEYWAVYYRFNREKTGGHRKGGDYCIFVDANSGEVLTNIRWK